MDHAATYVSTSNVGRTREVLVSLATQKKFAITRKNLEELNLADETAVVTVDLFTTFSRRVLAQWR